MALPAQPLKVLIVVPSLADGSERHLVHALPLIGSLDEVDNRHTDNSLRQNVGAIYIMQHDAEWRERLIVRFLSWYE